jgi:hypothetical protein
MFFMGALQRALQSAVTVNVDSYRTGVISPAEAVAGFRELGRNE